jgi:hypothetical protein
MARFVQVETSNGCRVTLNVEAVVYCRAHDTEPDVTVVVLNPSGPINALIAYEQMAALLLPEAGDAPAAAREERETTPVPLRRLATV